MEIKELSLDEITPQLLDSFLRRQNVTVIWSKNPETEKWGIAVDPRVDDWSDEDRRNMVDRLQRIASAGGLVLASVRDGALLGFAAVDPVPMGTNGQYLDFSTLHVTEGLRNQGLGTRMFLQAAEWAQNHGGTKLLISAHPSIETQGFYRSLGCLDAAEPQTTLPGEDSGYRQLEVTL